MSTKTYNRIRYITQIVLPALATFFITIGGAWGLDISENIGTTIAAIVTLMSGILGASSAIYDKEGGKYGKDLGNFDSDCTDDMFRGVHISNCQGRKEYEQEEQ